MTRNFTILLFILFLFSISYSSDDSKKLKKTFHPVPIKNCKVLEMPQEPAAPKVDSKNTNVVSHPQNNAPLIKKTNFNATHVLLDSSRNGYGWSNPGIRSIDRFCGIDAYGQDVDFLLLGYRHYNLSNENSGIIGAAEIDVSNGLLAGNSFKYTQLNEDLSSGTEGGRYPGVVAIDYPFIVFNQYVSGNPPITPAISHPYLITDWDGAYGGAGGDFTPSYRMDQGYTHHDFSENRLWNGPVSIVKGADEKYHYLGAYHNWIIDGESQPAEYALMNAVSVSSDPALDGWNINTDPTLIDTMDLFFSPRVAMKSSGFGVVAGVGHNGPHKADIIWLSDLMIMVRTTNDYGVTWSEPKELNWTSIGIPEEITPADSIWVPKSPGDTTYVLYDSTAYVATNSHIDVIVSENNDIYIAFNLYWGPYAGTDRWYPRANYCGFWVAVSDDEGASFSANRIAINNGFFIGDEEPPEGVDDLYYYSEIDLALDDTGNLYAAWLDRRRKNIEVAEKRRYGSENEEIELKRDIFASRSLDGGITWSDSCINITDSPSLDEYELNMALHADSKNDGTIYLAYCLVDPNSEPRPGGDDIYADRVNRIWVAEASNFIDDVGIKDNNKAVALETFALHQNYPNPFNPVTKIKFVPQKSGLAKLDVYSITGEKVAELYKAYAKRGLEYEIDFDGSPFAAGVYFYRLKIGNHIEVKKMVLIK
jgi:hypothetical protein